MHGALADLSEEVIPFIINEDEGWEIFDFNLPDRFHAELGEVYDFLRLDVFLGQEGSWATCGSKIEAAVLVAGVGDHLGAVAFRQHDHGCSVFLEEVDVRVHAASGGGAE